MSSYAYGSLVVPVSADTKQLGRQVGQAATRAGDDAARSMSQRMSSGLGKAAGSIGRGVATGLGTATLAATAFGVQAFKAAARVGEMDAALRALAKANKVSYPELQKQVAAIRKQGIEAGVAQQTVAEFTKGHLDMAKASKLARVAQDAAVISGRNSTEVLDGLVHGIVTQQTDVLRTAGINIDAAKAQDVYAKSIGKTTATLTAGQKQQAVLNAVLANGKTMAGAYASAMEEPGKVLRSFPRLLNDIQVSIGQGLVKAFGPAILAGYHFAKALDAAIMPGGALSPIFDAIGKAAGNMVAPLTAVIKKATEWVTVLTDEGWEPKRLHEITGAISKFAPVIASLGAALATFAGGNIGGNLPVIGKLLGGLGGPIGVVVTGLATLALTSPDARKALGQLASTLAGVFMPLVAQLTPIIAELGLTLGHVLGAALQAIIPLVPVLVVALDAALKVIIVLLPVITWLANVLADMAPVLVPLIAIWYGLSVATGLYTTITEAATIATIGQRVATVASTIASKAMTAGIIAMYVQQYIIRAATIAWTAAQWLLNAALTANPIGLVIVALVALAAALYLAWTKSATFRDVVISVWKAIWGFVAPIVKAFGSLISTVFGGITKLISSAVTNWKSILKVAMTVLLTIMTGGMYLLVRTVATHWTQIVSGAKAAGGSIINGLKSGISSAISGIGSWIKKSIVDPIVNAVKHFFGIHSPSTVMEGIGGFLMKGLFLGMVPGISGVGNLIGSVFGGFPGALAGLIGHGLVGIASLPGKALNAIMSLFGGGGDSARLAAEAAKYAGHRYVWGGPANASAGFDCSSFVNMLAGSLGLSLPGGFKAPSNQHGPSTVSWLPFGGMKHPGYGGMAMNDLYVNDHHMGVVTGKGTGFAARSTATGTGPQSVGSGYTILRFPGGGIKLPNWLEGIRGKVMGLFGKVGGFFGRLFGGGPSGGEGNPGSGVGQWRGTAQRVLGMFGLPGLIGPLMAQMSSESGGNAMAQNNWDSNARAGTPSKGLMQVIQGTFDAFAGPFRGLGIWNPMANIYAAVAYALKRYGANLAAVWGHGHGYAKGGVISEKISGIGHQSGQLYHFGERGPELVSPLTGPHAGMGAMSGRASPVIHVHPSAGMDERQLAALVSRELAWATAGGMT